MSVNSNTSTHVFELSKMSVLLGERSDTYPVRRERWRVGDPSPKRNNFHAGVSEAIPLY
jgi:hypothetical protein